MEYRDRHIFEDIAKKFEELSDRTQPRVNKAMADSVAGLLRFKKDQGLEGLHFYKNEDMYVNSEQYICFTSEEKMLLFEFLKNTDTAELHINDLEEMLNKPSVEIYAPSTEISYYHIDDLKHDLLAVRLADL